MAKIQNLSLLSTKEKLLSHLLIFEALNELKKLITTRDRDKLNTLLQPTYKKLQMYSKQSINVYTIYLPDGTSLLRLHKPDFHGDNNLLTRPLLQEVLKTKNIMDGFEELKI